MYVLTVYVKEGVLFALDVCLENSMVLTYVFNWLYFTQCLTSFSSINHLLCLHAWFLILFHPTYMRFSLSIYLLMFVFGDFNVHYKDWLTYSGGTDRPGEWN